MNRILLFALLLISSNQVFPQNNNDALLLYSGTTYPAKNTNEFINESISIDEIIDGYYYRIIVFNDFPDEKQKAQITASGIILNSYIPYHAYNCAIPKNFDRSKAELLNIKSIIHWDISNKLHRELTGPLPSHVIIEKGKADLVIHYQQNISPSKARELLEASGFHVLNSLDAIHTFTVRISLDRINQLAKLPFIYFVEPISPPSKKDDSEGRSLHRSNIINADYATGRHYDGTGVTVGLADDGEIGPHIDFTGRVTQHLTGLGGNHGDMTSGICVGAGNLIQRIRGMGTGAYLHVFDISGYPHVIDAVSNYNNYGIVILSTSYAQSCNIYNTDSQLGDQLIHDNPPFSFCFSAGNEGTTDCSYGAGNLWGNITGGYKLGKNVIAVGNLNEIDILEASSSRGPASDGRIKPDICSYGNYQNSTDEGNTYSAGSGTSAACPGVAGCLSQIYQAYKELTGASNPPSALIKACVLNTGDDLGNPGPDFKHGWGRINSFRAVKTLEDHRYISDSVVQGQTNTHNLTVPADVKQLRLMLYWHDKEGSPASSKSLVNDLNLQLTDPLSAVTLPWVLDPTPNVTALNSLPVRGVDNLNNVEQITIDNPQAGLYSISVDGFQVPIGTQEYYIVYELRTDSITLTYPIGGEAFVPGETEIIRWDAFGDSSTFNLRYTLNNGSTWSTLTNSLPGTQRHYAWTVPVAFSDQVLVEVNRNGIIDVSDTTFMISRAPVNLHVTFVCPDSIGLSWNAVPNVTGYDVSMLGSKYMDYVGTTTTTNFTVTGIDPLQQYWFSVKALGPNGGKGYRAIAIQSLPGLFNCNLSVNGSVTKIVNPSAGLNTDCQDLTNAPVKINIVNLGLTSMTNFTVNYLFNGNPIVSENFPGTILPGDSAIFTFSQTVSIPSPGNFNLTSWINLSGDVYLNDDSTAITINVIPGTLAPTAFLENFEAIQVCSTTSNCELTNCALGSSGWINASNTLYDDIDWRVSQGLTPSTSTGPDVDHTIGTGTGNYLYLEASTCTEMEADLLSPCIDLNGITTPWLTFWYHMYGADMGSLHVDVIGENQVYSDIILPKSGNLGNTWRKDSVDLGPFTGQTIVVRFRGITGDGILSDMALDDIAVFDISTGINDPHSENQFYIYPNPGNGVFNYKMIHPSGKSFVISVHDMLGKIVFEKNLSENVNDHSGVIDLTAQEKGVYSVTFRSDNFSKEVRLVKID